MKKKNVKRAVPKTAVVANLQPRSYFVLGIAALVVVGILGVFGNTSAQVENPLTKLRTLVQLTAFSLVADELEKGLDLEELRGLLGLSDLGEELSLGSFQGFTRFPNSKVVAYSLNSSTTLAVTQEITIASSTLGYFGGTMTAGSDEISWCNRTGETVFVTDVIAGFTSGTASSSQDLWVFATSSATVANSHDYTALTLVAASTSINRWRIATSTQATTTTSRIGSRSGTSAELGEVPVLQLANNDCLIAYLQQSFGNFCTGSVCEVSTSTNRGYNPIVKFRTLR